MRSKTEVRFHQIRFSLQARGPFPDAEQHLWGLRSHFYLIGYLDFLFSRGLYFLFFSKEVCVPQGFNRGLEFTILYRKIYIIYLYRPIL